MVLYVDETETDDFFIVSGMLAESKERKSKKFDIGSVPWYYHAIEMSSWFLVTGCAVNVDSSLFLFKVLAFFL